MKTIFPLGHLFPGESARVEYLRTKGDLARRLVDLGFVKGSPVQCLMQSAAGDPTAYKIRGAVIALRKKDAEWIDVCSEGAHFLWG